MAAAVLRGGKRGKREALSGRKLIDDNLPCLDTQMREIITT